MKQYWGQNFCENSRVQLRICSIPEEHKTEKKGFEMGKRGSLIYLLQPLPQTSIAQHSDPLSPPFLPHGKE